ncbi:MAG: antiviral reverse transcriptase Drt3b [Dehalococcoidia bacterium]
MKRRKTTITNKKERVILSDVLPYEIPAIFSNRHLYDFLVENKIKINGDAITWGENTPFLPDIVKLIFGLQERAPVSGSQIKIGAKDMKAIPFTYKVSHKEDDFRELTIIHPKNQLAMIEFYEKYEALILYYCDVSPFSIRKPHKVAKFTYRKDKTHFENLAHDHEHKAVEEFDKEYENLKTYFVYKSFSNVYNFYESYKYHRCEKRYNRLFKFDISKCFDSIYTHSVTWSLLNKIIVKDNIEASKGTFGGKFDNLMQNLNYGETNGIVIGPEFSRIFAEMILQQIDYSVLCTLEEKGILHKTDYEIFRYVDDFFVFYNEEKTKEAILEAYRLQLKEYKMYINDLKSFLLDKPIITGLTRAKQQISDLINDKLSFRPLSKNKTTDEAEEEQYSFYVSSNKLITKFKAIIKETEVIYKDILNYTLACVDRKVLKLINSYNKLSAEDRKEQEPKITKAVIEILDFTFFLYSVSPRVNTTIKLCMIISKLTKFSRIKGNFNYDNKHLILKKIYDDIFLVLRKNKSSEHIQVETLYLLIALKDLGREYRLDEGSLSKYFDIDLEEKRCKNLNYFSIIVLLFYIENKTRYTKTRNILKSYIMSKFKEASEYNRHKAGELTLLLFDLLACPFIDELFKRSLLLLYGIKDPSTQTGIIQHRKFWFTKWTDFDFGKELDAKKSQEVY